MPVTPIASAGQPASPAGARATGASVAGASLAVRLAPDLTGAPTLEGAIAAVERLLDDVPDIPSSRIALPDDAAALDAVAPDALTLLPRLLRNAFVARRRYPRAMNADIDVLRRLGADRVAGLYPHPDAHDGIAGREGRGLRVSMVLPHLLSRETANLTQVALSYAEGLAAHPDVASLDVVLTNEFSVPGDAERPFSFRADTALEADALAALFEAVGVPASRLHHAAPPLADGPDANARDVAAIHAAIAPDVVFVPNVELSAAHAHGMGRGAATVFLQTSLRNRPALDFDRYLYLGERRAIDATHIHPARWDYHPFCYARFGFGGAEAVPWPDGARTIATVGNRLEREVTREFADTVCAALRSDERAHWALVGVQDAAALQGALGRRATEVAARIHLVPFTAHLGDLLAQCVAYANPLRTGGAVSMSVAVHAGTPVLTYPGNDACTFVIPELVALDERSYAHALLRLVADEPERKRLAALQSGVFERYHSPAGSADDLVGHFHTALRARARSV